MNKEIEKLIFEGTYLGIHSGTTNPKIWAKAFIEFYGLDDKDEKLIIAWFKGAIKSGYNEAFDKWAEKD